MPPVIITAALPLFDPLQVIFEGVTDPERGTGIGTQVCANAAPTMKKSATDRKNCCLTPTKLAIKKIPRQRDGDGNLPELIKLNQILTLKITSKNDSNTSKCLNSRP